MSSILGKVNDDFSEYVEFCKEGGFKQLFLTPITKNPKFREDGAYYKFNSFYKYWDYLKGG